MSNENMEGGHSIRCINIWIRVQLKQSLTNYLILKLTQSLGFNLTHSTKFIWVEWFSILTQQKGVLVGRGRFWWLSNEKEGCVVHS